MLRPNPDSDSHSDHSAGCGGNQLHHLCTEGMFQSYAILQRSDGEIGRWLMEETRKKNIQWFQHGDANLKPLNIPIDLDI
jgi:hypothetical protein